MPTPTSNPADLKGKRRGWWYVVDFAGQRDGVNFWQCVCREHVVERLVAEPNIRGRKTNTLSLACRCQEPLGILTDHVYGLLTVVGPAGPLHAAPEGDEGRSWRCRCACGTERAFTENALVSRRVWSCGCRPGDEVRREWESKQLREAERFWKADSQRARSEREKLDRGWTAAMERALRAFQPKCLLCEVSEDLTTHHVLPLSRGHGKRPGNAVRLCRVCNVSIHDREIGALTPHMAAIIESGAAQFKEYWESECTAAGVRTAAAAVARPKDPDPALVAILRSVECGDGTAIPALASWLEERGDPRASAIREVRGDSLVQPAQLFRWYRSNEVWRRLGLSWSERATLKDYLGITPMGVAASIEDEATGVETELQTIRKRNRIDLALHKLACPTMNQRGSARPV